MAALLALVGYSAMNKSGFDANDYDWRGYIGPNEWNGEIGDHVRGSSEAKVIIVEYGDLGCSHCAQVAPIIHEVAEKYGDKVGVVFRHFLLGGPYVNSLTAATFAEAAGMQGYFSEAVDTLYANQAVWFYSSVSEREGVFLGLIKQAVPEIDGDKLMNDLKNKNITKKIDFDKKVAKTISPQIEGTPTVFLNGEKLDGSVIGDRDALSALIDKVLAE